jgi:ComF family protein
MSAGLAHRPRTLARAASRLAATFVACAFPQRCPGCGRVADARELLCAACRARIPELALTLCARCLVLGRDPVGCGRHSGYAVRPAWVYDARAAAIVTALKFEGRPGLARSVVAVLARACGAHGTPDLVLPVPLHPARERERGYNQSARLAGALAEHVGAPVLDRALVRARPTRAQSRLGPRRRRENVADAFRVAQPWAVRGRRVRLVDDVITTGATLEACLSVLREAGAEASAITLAWAC